jgi:hypothetical protein
MDLLRTSSAASIRGRLVSKKWARRGRWAQVIERPATQKYCGDDIVFGKSLRWELLDGSVVTPVEVS